MKHVMVQALKDSERSFIRIKNQLKADDAYLLALLPEELETLIRSVEDHSKSCRNSNLMFVLV